MEDLLGLSHSGMDLFYETDWFEVLPTDSVEYGETILKDHLTFDHMSLQFDDTNIDENLAEEQANDSDIFDQFVSEHVWATPPPTPDNMEASKECNDFDSGHSSKEVQSQNKSNMLPSEAAQVDDENKKDRQAGELQHATDHTPSLSQTTKGTPRKRRSKKTRRPPEANEKRYRNKLSATLDELREAVPTLRWVVGEKRGTAHNIDHLCCGLEPASNRRKPTVLAKAIEYIRYLEKKNDFLSSQVERMAHGHGSGNYINWR